MTKAPAPKWVKLENLKTVHVIGVCGTLMGAFAAFLKRRGIEVTGSDQNVYPPMSDVLAAAGVKLLTGFDPSNLMAGGRKPDLVVIGNVITGTNPEARAAIEGGFVYSSLPEAMEQLMLQSTRNLVVAGTHGKTTTSSMLAHVLNQCGLEPNWFIGGVSYDLPHSFQLTSTAAGRPFVLEGDEYDTAFWDKVPKFNHYLPDDTILTSVEYDHADIYPDMASVVRAFEGLVARIRPGGRIIACMDYAEVVTLVSRSKVPVIGYGAKPGPGVRYWVGNAHVEGEWSRFSVMEEGKGAVAELELRLPGHHNALNALSAWIECRELGLDPAKVKSALASFRGVKRRQEVRGEVKGVTVLDDFAHHPTAVRETLRALRARYPKHRLVAVFEPRSATSRRRIFQKEYAVAFDEADAVFISAPYDQSRIQADDQFSSAELVRDIVARGKPARVMTSIDEGIIEVARSARSGDLIAVLSNGGFGGFVTKLLKELEAL